MLIPNTRPKQFGNSSYNYWIITSLSYDPPVIMQLLARADSTKKSHRVSCCRIGKIQQIFVFGGHAVFRTLSYRHRNDMRSTTPPS